MAHQPRHALLERCDPGCPVDVLVLDLDGQRPGHHPPHREETQAPLILLIRLRRLITDPRVEERERLALRGPHHRGRFWLTLDGQAREDKLGELSDWIDAVLRAQYPGYLAEQIRPCWPSHPEALWELTWLYQLWCRAYLTKRPAPKDAADWHDRWAPGVLRRLGQVMARCDLACQSRPSREPEVV